ncbi:MAG: hypothetical protein V3U54_11775 [Thermodesulfobacteriota bacterium]
MDKLRELIAEVRNINTNDPAFQRRIVNALDAIAEALDEKVDVDYDEEGHPNCGGCNCDN